MSGYEVLVFIAGVALGAGLLKLVERILVRSALASARQQADEIRETARQEAKTLKQESELQGKEEIQTQRRNFEREMRNRKRDIEALEERLVSKETRINQKLAEIAQKEGRVRDMLRSSEAREAEVKASLDEQKSRLEKISGMSADQAKGELFGRLQAENEKELAARFREAESRFQEAAHQRAVRILTDAMARCDVDLSLDPLVSVVKLPHDEMKGRIIGREGRNIRAFEHLAGVDVIVDDSPGIVVLSAYNPLKREIARAAMEKLVADGRIHPTKIEQALEQAQKDLQDAIREAGEQAAMKCGIHGIGSKLIFEIGKLRYKVSLGQNLLEHSMEVAELAGLFAAEIGADVAICKRAGLLHDIGKLSESEETASHSALGAELARRCGEREPVPSIIASHHDDPAASPVEAALVQMANTLSAERPGARKGELVSFVRRLSDMEALVREFPGVGTAFILQAGREIRVLVRPEEVSDAQNQRLASDIARKLQATIEYPGAVKVTVIRETRAVDVAK
ncbi:MAG: ribonuclease Y [Candidatus Riflebacteria bacterium]|nr:ribonuclease Y [Candidatus Riflebacteria bacterium]